MVSLASCIILCWWETATCDQMRPEGQLCRNFSCHKSRTDSSRRFRKTNCVCIFSTGCKRRTSTHSLALTRGHVQTEDFYENGIHPLIFDIISSRNAYGINNIVGKVVPMDAPSTVTVSPTGWCPLIRVLISKMSKQEGQNYNQS